MVVETDKTKSACRKVVATMSEIQGALEEDGSRTTDWRALNEKIRAATYEFLDAARQELDVDSANSA
jgi:hypothetical protein